MSEDFKLTPMFQQNKTFTTEFRGVRYEYYLTGPIGPSEDYMDLCNILRSASEQDEVVIRINSGGGYVSTGNMIINAISESQANVIGFIESECGSMATFIFLACHTWGVSDAAEFFAHTASYGTWGKESENYSQAEFMRKQTHKFIRKRYKNFLFDDEIENIILGQDVFLDSDEIMDRLELFSAAREEQGCGDENCTECNQEPEKEFNLKDMIKEAVTEALAERDAPKAVEKTITSSKKRSTKPKNTVEVKAE